MCPTTSKLLKPEIPKGIEDEIQHKRQKAKQQYDKTAKNSQLSQQDKLFEFSQLSARSNGGRAQS